MTAPYPVFKPANLPDFQNANDKCKRIDNALIFAFALLKGEVNAVDLIVIETLRALVPKLYEIIRSNRDYLLGWKQG